MAQTCPVAACQEPMPHEHRIAYYDIASDVYVREVSAQELGAITAWRVQHGLAPLLFEGLPRLGRAVRSWRAVEVQVKRLRALLGMPHDGTTGPLLDELLTVAADRLDAVQEIPHG